MPGTIPPSLEWIPDDKTPSKGLKPFGVMLNKLWQQLFGLLAPLFTQSSSYGPVLTAQTGTFTAATATGRYIQLGRLVFIEAEIIITTVGTGTYPIITLPVKAAALNGTLGRQEISCRETTAGFMCIPEVGLPDSAHLLVIKYDGTSPSSSGAKFVLSGFYEIN